MFVSAPSVPPQRSRALSTPGKTSSSSHGVTGDVSRSLSRSASWTQESICHTPSSIASTPAQEGPIRAYAKLEFPGFSYYIQTLQVTIGRRPQGVPPRPPHLPSPSGSAASSALPAPWFTPKDVDVDLGPLKSISRLHARIFYSAQPEFIRAPLYAPTSVLHHQVPATPATTSKNLGTHSGAPVANNANASADADVAADDDQSDSALAAASPSSDSMPRSEGRFMLEVLGRNGAFVDDVWVSVHGVVPLGQRTKIQIAERVFYFVLPPPISSMDNAALDEGIALSGEDEAHDEDNDDDMALSSGLSDMDTDAGANIVDSTGVHAKTETGSISADLEEERLRCSPTTLNSTDAPQPPKFVLKPRTKVTSTAVKRLRDDDDDEASDDAKRARPASGTVLHDKAKGKGKGKIKEKESDKDQVKEKNKASTKGKGKGKGKGPGKGAKSIKLEDSISSGDDNVIPVDDDDDDEAPLSLHKSSPATTNSSMPMFQKPDLSNVQLITNALSSESCSRKGHKLTLQEVNEWLQNTYPWFSQNGRKTGRDWQSSIRHTISSSREFVKIPRRPDEPGKGIFYTLSGSELAKAHVAVRPEPSSAHADDTTSAHTTASSDLKPPSLSSVVTTVPSTSTSSSSSNRSSALLSTGNLSTSPSVNASPATLSAPTVTTTSASSAAPSAPPASSTLSSSAQHQTHPPHPSDTKRVMPRIPLVVGVPPQAESSAPRTHSTPGSLESLLETPPIAHHQGKLYLSPSVFGHLTREQLDHIEGLGAQQALQILQTYLVTHLKAKMRKASTSPGVAPTTASARSPTPSSMPSSMESSASTSAAVASSLAATSRPAVSPAPSSTPTLGSSSATMPSQTLAPIHAPRATSGTLPTSAPTPTAAPFTTSSFAQRLEAPKVPRIPVATKSETSIPPSASFHTTSQPSQATTSEMASLPTSTPHIPKPADKQNDPLSAISALAAHPEAAGLITLLKKQQAGGHGTVKLTAGQLELLQLANRLAMQRKKKKPGASPSSAGSSASGSSAPAPPDQIEQPQQHQQPSRPAN